MFQDIGEGAKIRRASRYIEMRRHRDRLSGIENLRPEELLETLVDLIGEAMKKPRPIIDAQRTPRPFQRRLGGLDRGIDVIAIGLFDDRDNVAGSGINIPESRAIALRRSLTAPKAGDSAFESNIHDGRPQQAPNPAAALPDFAAHGLT